MDTASQTNQSKQSNIRAIPMTAELIAKLEAGEDELLTVHRVAQIYLVDDTTARRWVKQGLIEVVVPPHGGKRQAYRILKSSLAKLGQQQQ